MIDDRSKLSVEEFASLRATIRERGTARVLVTAITFLAWAGLVAVVATRPSPPGTRILLSLALLVGLAGGFEAAFLLSAGAERIGRYLATHYEANDGLTPRWEHAIAKFTDVPGSAPSSDPFFVRLFAAAALINFTVGLPVASAAGRPLTAALAVGSLVIHGAFLVRLIRARQFGRTQRSRDTEVFSRSRTAG